MNNTQCHDPGCRAAARKRDELAKQLLILTKSEPFKMRHDELTSMEAEIEKGGKKLDAVRDKLILKEQALTAREAILAAKEKNLTEKDLFANIEAAEAPLKAEIAILEGQLAEAIRLHKEAQPAQTKPDPGLIEFLVSYILSHKANAFGFFMFLVCFYLLFNA